MLWLIPNRNGSSVAGASSRQTGGTVQRVVVQLKSGTDLIRLLPEARCKLSRTITTNLFIFRRPMHSSPQRSAAARTTTEVSMSYPVMRRQLGKHSAYAFKPDDPYFLDQWNLENRAANGTPSALISTCAPPGP